MSQLTLESITNLSKTGVLFVCASCPKMWEGRAEGRDGCTAESCGSPMGRKDFPEYSGEIKKFEDLCFVCGAEDVLAYLMIEGSQRKFGVCQKHLEMVDNYVPRSFNGNLIVDRRMVMVPNPKKALSEYKSARHEI